MIRRSEYLIGTASDWAGLDPVLPKGQMTVETPNDAIKVGDGVSRYSELDYITTGNNEADVLDGGTP